MDPAQTLHNTQVAALPPAADGDAPASPAGASIAGRLRRWRPHAMGALVVGVALVASEETRVLALLIGFAAVVAALAGPWGLRFWRFVQPSLFVEVAGADAPPAPAPSHKAEPRPWRTVSSEHEPLAAD